MKRVFITGATGFIGQHCLPILKKGGFEIHALSYNLTSLKDPDIHWHDEDLSKLDRIASLLKEIQPTHLLHLAWYVEHGLFWTSPENNRWVDISRELMDAFIKNGGLRFVGAGTCAEYAPSEGLLSEDISPLLPNSLYGACKKAVYERGQQMAAQKKVSFAWGRIFHLYGPHENPGRLIPYVITSLLNGATALCSNGNQKRDFLYVEDVASAFVKLLDSDVGGAVNIVSGQPVHLKDLLHKIGEKMGKSELIQLGGRPDSPDDPAVLVGDDTKLKDLVKWKPRYKLETGLEKTIEWWMRQKH